MGRIKRGGGNDGEPVRSPPGWLTFRRPRAGFLPRTTISSVPVERLRSDPGTLKRHESVTAGTLATLLLAAKRSVDLKF